MPLRELSAHAAAKEYGIDRKNLERYAQKLYQFESIDMKSNYVTTRFAMSSVTKKRTSKQTN